MPATRRHLPTATTSAPPRRAPVASASNCASRRAGTALARDGPWLGEQNGGFYSIQLLGSDDPELLREYFKTIAKYLEIEKVYVYRTVANRHPSLTVLYGTFATRDEVNADAAKSAGQN